MNDAQAMSAASQALKNASLEQLAELRDLCLTLCANEGLSQAAAAPPPSPKRRRAPKPATPAVADAPPDAPPQA